MYFRRSHILLTCALSLAGVTACTLAGLDGSERSERAAECIQYGGDPSATFFYPNASEPVAQPYELRVAAVFPYFQTDVSWSGPSVALDTDADGVPELLGARADTVDGRIGIIVTSWNPYSYPPHRDVCSGPSMCICRVPGEPERRIAVWNASFSYEPAPAESAHSATALFIRNLSNDAMSGFEDRFLRAAREASRGHTLRARKCIEKTSFDGNRGSAVELPSDWNGKSGVECGDGSILLTMSNGYGSNELHYALVDQPRLTSRVVDVGRGSASPYGSARGLARVAFPGDGPQWMLRTGPAYSERCTSDIDSDGAEDILIATYSAMNGVSGAGTTDLYCGYVLRLDGSGNEVWRRRLAGAYLGNQLALGDVNADEQEDIVAVSSGVTSTHHGEIVVLSADGSLVARHESSGGMVGLILADLNGDGTPEIVSGGSDGRVIAFSGQLETLAEFADTAHVGCAERLSIPILANDLDGDGKVELAVLSNGWTLNRWNNRVDKAGYTWSRHMYLTILSSELQEEARIALPHLEGIRPKVRGGGPVPNNFALDLNGDGVNEVILFTNAGIYVIGLVPVTDCE